jgi:hypothetical protein
MNQITRMICVKLSLTAMHIQPNTIVRDEWFFSLLFLKSLMTNVSSSLSTSVDEMTVYLYYFRLLSDRETISSRHRLIYTHISREWGRSVHECLNNIQCEWNWTWLCETVQSKCKMKFELSPYLDADPSDWINPKHEWVTLSPFQTN